jgi:hypothetical protein
MGTLFRDVWLWCLLSFLLGSLITWAVMRVARKPKVEVAEERLDGTAMGDRMGRTGTATTAAAAGAAAGTAGAMRDTSRARDTSRPTEVTPDESRMTDAQRMTEASRMRDASPEASRMRDASPDEARMTDASRTSDSMRGTGTAGPAGLAGTAGAAGMAGAAGSRAAKAPGDKATAMAGSGSAMRMVQPGEFPGSARSNADGSAPSPEYTVKADVQSMLYHTPDSPSYRNLRAEVWFKSTIEAERAGFVAWNRNPRDARTRRA